jgi:hypothetical protein
VITAGWGIPRAVKTVTEAVLSVWRLSRVAAVRQ